MKKSLHTRSIVIAGYCILVLLAITGFVAIYLEVVKSNRQGADNTFLRKELIDLSNTLSTMYEAEGTANLLAFADNEHLMLEYDSLSSRVLVQIDSLRHISTNNDISSSLDSLSVLLLKKRDNALIMFQSVKQIDKNIVDEITKKTIITRSDIDKLNDILAEVTTVKEDTALAVTEKKSFFRRLKDVVNPNASDTIKHISKGSTSEKKALVSPVVTDTIIDFIRQIDKQTQKKNAVIIRQVIARQHELYIIKELTGFHINKIMDSLEEQEYLANTVQLKEKNDSLKRSTLQVSLIGLSAIIVAVFFMSWILKSLNESRRLQKNIQEARKNAETLLKSREQLIYTITHDIKAPLSSIIGFLDLIKGDALSQKQQYYVQNMHSSASHILDLVRNLLDFHSIEKQQFQLTLVAFSPASLIRDIYESFLPLAQKKNLSFKLNSTLSEKKIFLSDPYYIRQIVNNLLSNAIKFTPEQGSISLVASMEKTNCWKVAVQDNGQGIELADQVKIFDEFIRLDKTRKEMEGSGLGLPISKKLATLLGGTIEVKSQKGAGSVFTLSIPLTPALEDTVFNTDTPSVVSSDKILFVDDDQIQLNLLSEWMKREGLPYICCSSGYEALEYIGKESVAIVFTDIHIPGMEGFELIKRIRQMDFPKAATLPVIAFSAGFQGSFPELKTAGFNEFLFKPCKPHQLMDIIEKYTPLKRKTDEIYQNDESGWRNVIDFVSDDQAAATKIIDSFIEETVKSRKQLKNAFQKDDNESIQKISHKMLTLMRMISAHEIVSLLADFEKGDISKEKRVTLFRLIEEKIEEAKGMRQMISEMEIEN